MLSEHAPYKELGASYLPTDHPERRAQGLFRQLQGLGFTVTTSPIAPQVPVSP